MESRAKGDSQGREPSLVLQLSPAHQIHPTTSSPNEANNSADKSNDTTNAPPKKYSYPSTPHTTATPLTQTHPLKSTCTGYSSTRRSCTPRATSSIVGRTVSLGPRSSPGGGIIARTGSQRCVCLGFFFLLQCPRIHSAPLRQIKPAVEGLLVREGLTGKFRWENEGCVVVELPLVPREPAVSRDGCVVM
jgi:hypothetical protein